MLFYFINKQLLSFVINITSELKVQFISTKYAYCRFSKNVNV